MYERILVPTDGSDAAGTAVDGGICLAEAFGADLHAVHVAPSDTAPEDDAFDAGLSDVLDRTERANVPSTTTTLPHDGPVHEAIVEYVEEHGVDLLLMGTRGRTGLGRFALGSVTERTLRAAPVPVLTVREETPIEDAPTDVLVATDGSEGAEAAVDHAVDLAATTGATLHIAHVVDVTVAWPTGSGGPILDALEGAGREAVDRAVERADQAGVESVEATLLSGSPYRAIVDYASEADVDWTVVGTHGRTGLDRLLLGSVAERVIRTAGTPVLGLKATDAEPAETDWSVVYGE